MPSYYAYDTNFINSVYLIDIAVENHLKTLFFPNELDLKRIEYASNEYTFRQRMDNNGGSYNFPYINYHLKGMRFDNTYRWNNQTMLTSGMYIEELGAKVRYVPMILEYEATFWCNRDDETKYASSIISFETGSNSRVNFTAQVNTVGGPVDVELMGKFVIQDSSEVDSNFTEKDWLEKANIHSVTLDFTVYGLFLKTNLDVVIPEKVIFEFSNSHGVGDTYTPAEQYTFIIDRLNDELILQP